MRGPLGDRFSPGVHDPEGRFTEKERAIADWLLSQNPGLCIHPRHRDPAQEGPSPDAMVRTDPDDHGTLTEFKTLDEASTTSIKQNARSAIRQVLPFGNGDVVLDGRAVGLSEADARVGHARLVGERRQHGRPMPRTFTIILGDSRELTWRADV